MCIMLNSLRRSARSEYPTLPKGRGLLVFGDLQKDNTVVGYLNGKAIIMDEWNSVYYCAVPREFVNVGETVSADDLHPVSELPESEQRKIGALVAGL